MADQGGQMSFVSRMWAGFVAGFLGTLVFHQLMLAFLRGIGVAPAPFLPYSWTATEPFGIPAVLSLSFWGGLWGIIFVLIHGSFPPGAGYWVTAFVFGAILPSAIALLVVMPIKGRPMGGGWHASLLVTALLVNGAWGVGTGVYLKRYKNGQKRTTAP